MISETDNAVHSTANPITAADVAAILRGRGWFHEETEAASKWIEEAQAMLGPRVANCAELAGLLRLIFEYDARVVLAACAGQEVVCRAGARQVIRVLATEILSRGPVDSDSLKEIVNAAMAKLPYRSREIFLR